MEPLRLSKKEKILWGTAVLLIIIFFLSRYFDQIFRQVIGTLLIFVLPGMIILHNHKLEEITAFSPIVSVSLMIVVTFFLNIWLGIKIDDMFLDKAFFVLFAGIFLYRIFFFKNKEQVKESSNIDLYFLLILSTSAIFRVLILSKIGSLIGTDIVKFATMSYVMRLKEQINPDLRPYDLAYSFFYFPLSFTLPLILETLGINPITSITYFSFFFNILAIVAFFMLASRILDRKKALYATFFYSMFFDVSLDYLMSRGVFAFAIAFLPCFLGMYSLLEIFDGKRKDKLLLFSFLFLFLTHWYLFFVLLTFFISLTLYEFYRTGKFSKSKWVLIEALKTVPLILMLTLPFLILFLPNLFVQRVEKAADWKIYEKEIEEAPFKDKMIAIIFQNFATPITTVSYSLGFLVSILMFYELIKDKRLIITIFFILLIFSSIFYIHSITFKRFADYVKIVYPISFSLIFSHPLFIGVSTIFSPFVENTPIWYYLNVPEKIKEEQQFFFDVVGENELKAFEFIKENVSKDAVFVIDSGGAGCVGAQPFSHGERIFPLTSRKLFYFTNFCPYNINWEEYQKRVDLYRKISINPNDEETLSQLKNNYNVTHIYIGPVHVGLEPALFQTSKNYKLIYHENSIYIFEIV
jgi:hypothetical protein